MFVRTLSAFTKRNYFILVSYFVSCFRGFVVAGSVKNRRRRGGTLSQPNWPNGTGGPWGGPLKVWGLDVEKGNAMWEIYAQYAVAKSDQIKLLSITRRRSTQAIKGSKEVFEAYIESETD